MRKCKLVITNEGVFELFDGDTPIVEADFNTAVGDEELKARTKWAAATRSARAMRNYLIVAAVLFVACTADSIAGMLLP